MRFIETPLKGAMIIELQLKEDERGFFARSWCRDEFHDQGLNTDLVQCNVSFNLMKGTIRGMHYQAEPYPESKVVRCTMGSVYDVIIDLRPDSTTFKNWFGIELSAGNRKALYVPFGFAHGFQTLEDNSELLYQMSEFFHPELARGVRWNDPAFGIQWPHRAGMISSRDQQYPDFDA